MIVAVGLIEKARGGKEEKGTGEDCSDARNDLHGITLYRKVTGVKGGLREP